MIIRQRQSTHPRERKCKKVSFWWKKKGKRQWDRKDESVSRGRRGRIVKCREEPQGDWKEAGERKIEEKVFFACINLWCEELDRRESYPYVRYHAFSCRAVSWICLDCLKYLSSLFHVPKLKKNWQKSNSARTIVILFSMRIMFSIWNCIMTQMH